MEKVIRPTIFPDCAGCDAATQCVTAAKPNLPGGHQTLVISCDIEPTHGKAAMRASTSPSGQGSNDLIPVPLYNAGGARVRVVRVDCPGFQKPG